MENKTVSYERVVENAQLDEERALYGSKNLLIKNVRFDGPADGESAVKECENIAVEGCYCNLRYPFWHVHGLRITDTEMTELCRAALWYTDGVRIENSKLHGIKALRECADAEICGCDIISPEFGWFTDGIVMNDTTAVSEYFLMRASNVTMNKVNFKGKYSFQYVKGAVLQDCVLDTKDAFWHGYDITLKNCVVKGEYLAWYSERLTLINCTIIGTQPFCYCKKLTLINCRMENCDLAFEKSETDATITTFVDSIKNPYEGVIKVKGVGEIIRDDPLSTGKIIVDSVEK